MEKMLNKAICYATEKHAGQVRKGSETPYIVHPLEACAIAATVTADEEVMTAAVLHDVIEDTDATEDDVRELFGERVASLVCSDSENKRRELSPEESWKMRKQETIDFLNESATRDEKIIALADKLSNMRAIWRDYETYGEGVWKRFNQKNPDEHKWYYTSIARALQSELGDTNVWREYKSLVDKMFGE